MADEELEQLIERLNDYEVGKYHTFDDALPGEMEDVRLNIALFGMAGSGKSALINTIFECLGLSQPAVTQTTGKEGTKILETCDLWSHVTFYDTRGFGDLDKMEKGELFRIVFGLERSGDVLKRDHESAQKTASAGICAQRLEKPPIVDQMHVILWVIKANDIRFEKGNYKEIIKFVQSKLGDEVITIITVITFDDEIQKMPNSDEERKKLKEAAREVTGSEKRNIFMIGNWIPNQDFDPVYKKKVLQMLEQALKCGELSIKMRQTQRESPKKMAPYSRSTSVPVPQGRASGAVKTPVENTEPPDHKSMQHISWKSLP